jgi:hypothetical protein
VGRHALVYRFVGVSYIDGTLEEDPRPCRQRKSGQSTPRSSECGWTQRRNGISDLRRRNSGFRADFPSRSTSSCRSSSWHVAWVVRQAQLVGRPKSSGEDIHRVGRKEGMGYQICEGETPGSEPTPERAGAWLPRFRACFPSRSTSSCRSSSWHVAWVVRQAQLVGRPKIRMWLDAKKEWDIRFAKEKLRVQSRRLKELAHGFQVGRG